MRKRLIAGNWKMHGTSLQVKTLITDIVSGLRSLIPNDESAIDILVLPPFVHLSLVKACIADAPLFLGAQNLYLGKEGAFTGEVSGFMLRDAGCQYVLVGHSERRTLFHEDLSLVALKFKAALDAQLMPILCIGETKAEREDGKTEAVIEAQLLSVIEKVGIQAFLHAVIAYEPVWAIGTGLTATPDEAERVHAFIRKLLAQNDVALARTIRILYGGSMKADNAASLLAMPNIDGGLIGGASLQAESFLKICEDAVRAEIA